MTKTVDQRRKELGKRMWELREKLGLSHIKKGLAWKKNLTQEEKDNLKLWGEQLDDCHRQMVVLNYEFSKEQDK